MRFYISRLMALLLLISTAIHMSAYTEPLFFNDKVDKAVIQAFIKDSIPVEIDLIYDNDSLPDQYYSYIETPVCEEGICYDLKVHLYWDLLGNFVNYKEVASDPFTKYEHELFTAEDHSKLRKILADKTSPLANYNPEDLVDKSKTLYSPLIDAVVGATYPALKSSVVPGAVYSTHTLWNIVNGTLADKIEAYTIAHSNEAVLFKMAHSSSKDLQLYALRNLETASTSYPKILIQLVKDGIDYVPYFAIAKITQEMWLDACLQKEFISLLATTGFEMQNEILNGLSVTQLSASNIAVLLDQYVSLEKSQYRKLTSILKNNIAHFSHKEIETLKKIATETNNTFAPFANELLKNKTE